MYRNIYKVCDSIIIMSEEKKYRINYKTADPTWLKIKLARAEMNLNDTSDVMDVLIEKGYRAWKDEKQKEN